jgi:hypothetical protein
LNWETHYPKEEACNYELGTVEGIAQDGTMRLKLDDEGCMSFDP